MIIRIATIQQIIYHVGKGLNVEGWVLYQIVTARAICGTIHCTRIMVKRILMDLVVTHQLEVPRLDTR